MMDYVGGVGLMNLLAFLGYFYLACQPNGGPVDFWSKNWTWRDRFFILIWANLYTEVCSALLHLTADNPAFNDLPGFGSLARGFQAHHDDPAGIADMPWLVFLGKVNVGMLLLLSLGIGASWLNPVTLGSLWRNGSCQRSDSRYLTAFCLATVPMMYLMMATHRWTHCDPKDVPAFVWLMQKLG